MTDRLSPAVHYPDPRTPALRVDPRTASRALYGAVGTMVASMVAISLFFSGAGAFWGPINDLLVVATVLLLLPAMVAVERRAREGGHRWFSLLTLVATLGVLVIAVGQLALVAGLITLDTSFLTGGLGVLPVIAWIGATAALALRSGVLGRWTGWWALAFMAAMGVTVVVTSVGSLDMAALTAVLGVPLMVALMGWLVSLARDLSRMPTPADPAE